jgi:uncharacterized damage-inducible protein DinB
MVKRLPWFERTFPTGLPANLLPVVVERLRGTPLRLAERLAGVAPEQLVSRAGGAWSAQENAGHLLDMEVLWLARVNDLAMRRGELSEADLTNRRTDEAGHNSAPLAALLADFRSARAELVRALEDFADSLAGFVATHPRLRLPMNVVDLAYFVAEHDDYHLARITELRMPDSSIRPAPLH